MTTATTPTITAIVTRRGAASTVPDREDAVDADILVDGVEIGEVTLLVDHTGSLDTWGSLDMWASHAVIEYLIGLGEGDDSAILEIVAAVRAAA